MIERVGIASASRRFGPRGAVLLSTIILSLAVFILSHDCAFPQDRALAQLNVPSPPAQLPQAQPQVPQPQPAVAQPGSSDVAQPVPQSGPLAQPLTPPAQKEGFFDALGKWWDKSAADWDAGMKKLKSSIDETNERNAKAAVDAVTATRDATDALIKLPTIRIIEGKERCLLAPNGSPDCNAAAEKICKGKGFTSGKSADIESARKCSARALLSRSDADCVNETIVIRAACQ